MTAAQKFLSGIVLIGLVTTLVLPNRQSASVINSGFGGASGLLKTAIGQ